MENYFITRGTEKKGPFSIDDLSKMALTDDYLVWKDGFEKWKPITEIEELKSIVIVTPPPTPLQEKRKKQKSAFIDSLMLFGIMPFIWVVIFIIMGGFSYDEYLQQLYGSGEYAIYGGGEEIRKSLIYASFISSFGISLIIFIIAYIRKSRNITKLIQIEKVTEEENNSIPLENVNDEKSCNNLKFEIGAIVVKLKTGKVMRIDDYNPATAKFACYTNRGTTFEGYFDETEIGLF